MIVKTRKSFDRDVARIKNRKQKQRIEESILQVKDAEDSSAIINMRKLGGYDDCYRIRVGKFRIGISIVDDEVMFVRCLNRKDFYKHFP